MPAKWTFWSFSRPVRFKTYSVGKQNIFLEHSKCRYQRPCTSNEDPEIADQIENEIHLDEEFTRERKNTEREIFGSLLLLAVAICWGSFAPGIKFVLSTDHPPTLGTMNFIKSIIVVSSLSICCLFIRERNEKNGVKQEINSKTLNPIGKLLKSKTGSLFWSSLEIGMIESIANIAYTTGLKTTSASNASILTEMILVFVQLLAVLTGSFTHQKIYIRLRGYSKDPRLDRMLFDIFWRHYHFS